MAWDARKTADGRRYLGDDWRIVEDAARLLRMASNPLVGVLIGALAGDEECQRIVEDGMTYFGWRSLRATNSNGCLHMVGDDGSSRAVNPVAIVETVREWDGANCTLPLEAKGGE